MAKRVLRLGAKHAVMARVVYAVQHLGAVRLAQYAVAHLPQIKAKLFQQKPAVDMLNHMYTARVARVPLPLWIKEI